MNIALIGYRGTGKTSVARELARLLDWQWIDADVFLEQRAGRSIAEIFSQDGEATFRDLEAQLLPELCAAENTILALGGGVVIRPQNRDLLSNPAHWVVWLTAPAEVLARRIAADDENAARRPALTQAAPLAEIQQLLALREPWYASCADKIVETGGKSPGTIAAEIVQYWQARAQSV
ncbi:MAG: shikimate kinase [Pirellulales bacterium]|nr:shikimate kinase [Pirellulales bacterium]